MIAGRACFAVWAVIAAAAAVAAPPDLVLDADSQVLGVEYFPGADGTSTNVVISVSQEADGKQWLLGQRTVGVSRGRRVRADFSVPATANCLYRVQVTDGTVTTEEVKNLYTTKDRSPAKARQVADLLNVPLALVGGFLDRVTAYFMAPDEIDGVFLHDLASGTTTPLLRGEGVDNARVSPGGVVLFQGRDNGTGEAGVFVRRPGGAPVLVATGRWPVWSADGGAYFLRGDGLYTAQLDGGAARRVASPPEAPFIELLGPIRDGTGRLVVSSRLGSEDRQLWLVEPGSGQVLPLSYDVAYLWLPQLSPDGTELVRVEPEAGGTTRLVLQSLKDGKTKVLTEGAGNDRSPSWSPDGKSILFVSDRRR